MNRSWRPLIALLLLLVTSDGATGQILENLPQGGRKETSGGAYYNFSGGTGCDIRVSIWGYVRNPGRYNIPCETTILDLISFAGGPDEGALLAQLKIVRRGGAEKQLEIREVFELDLARHLVLSTSPEHATDLLLLPGDLVIVDGAPPSQGDAFLRVLQTIIAVASIVTTVIAVVNATKN